MEQKELTYAQKCGIESKKTGLPFEVVLATSPENASTFKILYDEVKANYERVGSVPLNMRKNLKINAFKESYGARECIYGLIMAVRSEDEKEAWDSLEERVEGLGFKNLKRVSDYLVSIWSEDYDA